MSQPNDLPTIKQLRKSQADGATGNGTNDETYNERAAKLFNHGDGSVDEQSDVVTHGLMPRDK
jgi:hypothetical protein